jgi:hypothetical protein
LVEFCFALKIYLKGAPFYNALQTALHAKAKESPNFRFHALYDKVYRKDVLAYAYERCKANGGAAGVDNQTFENIEAYGRERWLDELAQELKSRTYQPQPVRRVYIPKPDGKQRPLGITGLFQVLWVAPPGCGREVIATVCATLHRGVGLELADFNYLIEGEEL